MEDDLPYCVEYAKSGRASCRGCKAAINKDTLRLAALVQSAVHDGKIPYWYHPTCFFTKQRPQSSADIANFDNIRWDDQQDIKKKIEEAANGPPLSSGKGRKRGSTAAANSTGAYSDFLVEYAKSNKSMCRGCEDKIMKGEVRVAKKDYESQEAKRYGPIFRWHHLECFAKLRADLKFYDKGDVLPGAKSLSKEDQATLIESLPKIKQEVEDEVPIKKVKNEPVDTEEEELLKKQNKQMYDIRDKLSALPKNDLIQLLEKNNQQIPAGTSAILDRLSDAVCFGALSPCPKCSGQLVYTSGVGYKCTGDLTEWTKCEYVTQDPKRKKFVIPSELKDTVKLGKLKVQKRVIKVEHLSTPSTSHAVKKDEVDGAGPKLQPKPKLFRNMEFVVVGRTQRDKETLKKEIGLLGGTIVSKIHDNLAAVISTQAEIEKKSKKIKEAEEHDIQVITEDFLDEAKECTDAVMLIKKKTISSWGGDLNSRIANIAAKSSASRGKSKFEKSVSGKVKLQVKGGGAVDPDSGLEDRAHVYQKGKNKFTVTLGITDVQAKKNSYYKLQILKDDKKNKYWLFRSWGRIGTTIGGTKLESMSLPECTEQFQNLYEEKTGNQWQDREHFVKVPHKMYPIDIDHGDDEEIQKLIPSDVKSNLKEPVQELIQLIFDVDNMKKVMLELEIDMDKMPLGKLSKKQIQKAYSVLTELQELIKKDNVERVNLIDATNRFYTLIPHNFGVSGPKILETMDEIRVKCEMLDALLEMEIAYGILHSSDGEASTKHPIDSHYEKLNTEIDVLDTTSEEYKIIEQYVKTTHAATHSYYQLEIENVFTIKRKGEDQRFKPFKKLPNRKLLWHGSRTTNYAGILSQGLRIAPPEAPVTGYMFGKGIYFADMVSKSANYCCTNTQQPTGLLLLCEVALGNMYERDRAEYVEKLPKGKHSTKGRGMTQPDPKVVYKFEDGLEVPYGPPVPVESKKSTDLLYNEYIVYDVAQVKVKYLVRVNFRYRM